MNKGRLFIISGPSGSGKDTVLKKIFAARPEFAFSISSITRPMRQGEVEGEKYNFISREKFEEMLKNDEFLEHNIFVGNYYGTPKAPVLDSINKGVDMIIEVDVNGANQIREKMPNCVSVFILPPSLSVLRNRLSSRGTESDELIKQRIDTALEEIKRATEYDYIVVNDDLEVAVSSVMTIIDADKYKTDRNLYLMEEIIG